MIIIYNLRKIFTLRSPAIKILYLYLLHNYELQYLIDI